MILNTIKHNENTLIRYFGTLFKSKPVLAPFVVLLVIQPIEVLAMCAKTTKRIEGNCGWHAPVTRPFLETLSASVYGTLVSFVFFIISAALTFFILLKMQSKLRVLKLVIIGIILTPIFFCEFFLVNMFQSKKIIFYFDMPLSISYDFLSAHIVPNGTDYRIIETLWENVWLFLTAVLCVNPIIITSFLIMRKKPISKISPILILIMLWFIEFFLYFSIVPAQIFDDIS